MATLRIAVVTALACMMLASAPATAVRAGETSEATFGSQWWTQSKTDAKYQEFREVPRGGFLESFVVRQWSGRSLLQVEGVNGLQSDQNTKLQLSNGIKYRLDLGYQETPHLFSQNARWGWTQISPGLFVLPDSLQARNQALSSSYSQRMLDYLKTAPGIGLGFDTRVSSARVRVRPEKSWQFEAKAVQRVRDGLKPFATSFGFNTALENPEPIDQRMLDVDVTADYRRAAFTMQASGGFSKFDNDISTLRVDNPKRITDVNGGDGTARSALDLYPDNQVMRGSIALGYVMPRQSSLIATLGIATGTQDDPFLPFTTNTALPQSNPDSLPAENLDGKTTQMTGDVRFRTRPVEKLEGAVKFHWSDFQNNSRELNFIGQAPYEASWQRFIEHKNKLDKFSEWELGADADYELSEQITVGALLEYKARERSPREVEKDKELVWGGRAHVRAPNDVSLWGDYKRGDRKMDEFLADDFVGYKQRAAGPSAGVFDSLAFIENPALRRFDVADRVQNQASVGLSMPLGDRIDLDASYSFVRNDYQSETGVDTVLGLDEEKIQSVSAGATIHMSEELDLMGSYGFGLTNSSQRSRASAATFSTVPDSLWSADLEDKETFANVGFEWAPPKRKITLSGQYEIARTYSTYDLGNGLNNAADLPDVLYRRQDVALEASWRWLARTTLLVRYNWQQFDMLDWAANDIPFLFPVTGTANAVFLGDSSRSYTANRVALAVRHRF